MRKDKKDNDVFLVVSLCSIHLCFLHLKSRGFLFYQKIGRKILQMAENGGPPGGTEVGGPNVNLHTAGMEAAAMKVLKMAVELDQQKRLLEAFTCYKEGVAILMDVLRLIPESSSRKKHYREKISEYMARAEKIKIAVERRKEGAVLGEEGNGEASLFLEGKFHEKFTIANNSIAHSYERTFSCLIDDQVTHVDVEDPYIRAQHQLLNFLRFCELLVKNAPNLKSIVLTTGTDENAEGRKNQESAFSEMRNSLKSRGIRLEVNYSDSLHDREIRGLDYFKSVSRFSLGYCDFDLRPCHETTVDIFHKSSVKSC